MADLRMPENTVRCSACAGTGTVVVYPNGWHGIRRQNVPIINENDLNKTCPDCHGAGVVPRLPAPDSDDLGEEETPDVSW